MNTVDLIGMLAARPVHDPVEECCAMLVVTSNPRHDVRERHRVVARGPLAAAASALAVGQTVFVTGSLQRDERRRAMVVARDLWPLEDAPAMPDDALPVGTHARPREHQRTGHWRRIGITTPRERLVWVRPTTVSVRRA